MGRRAAGPQLSAARATHPVRSDTGSRPDVAGSSIPGALPHLSPRAEPHPSGSVSRALLMIKSASPQPTHPLFHSPAFPVDPGAVCAVLLPFSKGMCVLCTARRGGGKQRKELWLCHGEANRGPSSSRVRADASTRPGPKGTGWSFWFALEYAIAVPHPSNQRQPAITHPLLPMSKLFLKPEFSWAALSYPHHPCH